MFSLFIRNFSKTKPLFPQIVELEFLYEIQNMKHVSLCELYSIHITLKKPKFCIIRQMNIEFCQIDEDKNTMEGHRC